MELFPLSITHCLDSNLSSAVKAPFFVHPLLFVTNRQTQTHYDLLTIYLFKLSEMAD